MANSGFFGYLPLHIDDSPVIYNTNNWIPQIKDAGVYPSRGKTAPGATNRFVPTTPRYRDIRGGFTHHVDHESRKYRMAAECFL